MPILDVVQDVFLLLCIPAAAWWTWKLTGGALVNEAVTQSLTSAKTTADTTAGVAKVLTKLLEDQEQRVMATHQLTAQLEHSRLYAPAHLQTPAPPVPTPNHNGQLEEEPDPDADRYAPLGRG